MNIGYEDDELKPHIEPEIDFSEPKRIEILGEMGYPKADIDDSLKTHKFDDIYATYILLGRRTSDVSICWLSLILSQNVEHSCPKKSKIIHI